MFFAVSSLAEGRSMPVPKTQNGCFHSNIAKVAKKCIKCARPTPPHTNPMESGLGNTSSAQNRKKTKRFVIFDPKKGGSFFDPPPTSLKTSKKWFQVGGVGGGSGPKTHWEMRLLDKIMIFQGVKLTIQPLGVGYANMPKKPKMGGVCGVFPDIRLPGFDLTTSACDSIAFGKPTSQRIYSKQRTHKIGEKRHK